jgi:hypothetical protein
VSRQKLNELPGAGDPKGRFKAFEKEFAVPAYPPRLPTKCYDMFWAHVVHKDDDGKYRIYEYGFCFSRAGPPGTTLNKWIIEEVYKGYEILPENIQK